MVFSRINATSLLFAFVYALIFTRAAPMPLITPKLLDIFSPQILYPNAATTWFAGQRYNVTWDTSNPPKNISNKALIQLKTASVSDWVPTTLASGFSLLDGRHEIKVPNNVTSRDDWAIVLFGDSENASPPFKIRTQY